jgi:hypothetical protein
MESSGKLMPTLTRIWNISPEIAYVVLISKDFLSPRVLYEVFPMSFLMEQAGGQSFTGKERVRILLLSVARAVRPVSVS